MEAHMKVKTLTAITLLSLSVLACEAERTGPNSVEISTDTAATAEAARQTETAAEAVAEESREAAQATETALREGARKTGTAMEEAGKDMQKHSKPGNQP